MTPEILTAENLAIGYTASRGSPHVLSKNINFSLRAGEFICLIGPNGIGKSTLLRTIAGMQPPLSGSVRLHGCKIHQMPAYERACHLAVVLTERVDVGTLSARALVTLGRHPYTGWLGSVTTHDDLIVQRALQAVNALALAERNFDTLSDGERQKIMIARALAQEPNLMILDEPTAFLDLPHRVEVMYLLRDLTRKMNRSILLSTHDLDLALRCADRLWLFGPDRSLQIGLPEDLVLSGALEAAFANSGVTFNRASGMFEKELHGVTTVVLEGDGLQSLWTRRALERAGFSIATESHSFASIVCLPEKSLWRLSIAGETWLCRSIAELLSRLCSRRELLES